MRRYRLNKEKFIEFICGVAALLIVEGAFLAILLKM